MLTYIARRLLQAIPVLLGVSFLVFSMLHLVPGDPVLIMLQGSQASTEQIEGLRHELGLDQPFLVQYGRYLWNLLLGDFGTSYRMRMPVLELILSQLGSTLQLTLASLALAVSLGIGLGVLAAYNRDSVVDSVSMGIAILGVSIPNYLLALVLILVGAVWLGWFPATGQGGWRRLVLPAVALGWGYAAIIARLVRQNLVEVWNQDFIQTARAKGATERAILVRHALKNSLIPTVTIVGLQFGHMIASAVIIETVFARQGIGRLIVQAITAKDFPLIQGLVMFTAAAYVLANILVDVSYGLLDPRVRHG
jgi:ABC-type dipeptide/oligopeptide/nickel transport system permease component